jgi:single-stranded DNA-binding protein
MLMLLHTLMVVPEQAFSMSSSRSSDVAKLILVGRLGKDPEVRITKNEKEYIS